MSGLNKSIIEKWFIGHVGTLYFLFGVCEKYKLSEIIITISSYCFGVYIFQQFILQFLYYKTSLPVDVGPYWLPWIGCLLTIFVSIFICAFFMRTRVGRYLIG